MSTIMSTMSIEDRGSKPGIYEWQFPLPRTHTGMLQGNGTLGLMIWGEGSVLRLTLGRADLWDHRGGLPWTEAQSYANIRDCLEQGDEPRLRQLFETTDSADDVPRRPSIIPVGRVELDFGDGVELTTGTVDTADGTVMVCLRKGRRQFVVRLLLDMNASLACVTLPPGLSVPKVTRLPAWQWVGRELAAISFQRPERFVAEQLTGWYQMLPADPGVCVGYRWQDRHLLIGVTRGDGKSEAKAALAALLDSRWPGTEAKFRSRINRWWRAYWRDAAQLDLPDADLAFLYDYGMYKFAGLTQPEGVAATLQGPWIEEYQMPPWSSDYHFNINVQMCYWPAFHGNRLEHLRPLFDMIHTWTPILRRNAHAFLGIDDGLMLPHAVDDHCTCMGGFWTGSIDHGCTAWVAQMMYRYYRYTMDRDFLERVAFPFMQGAMRVYEEMLEEETTAAGRRYVLPVSVSPEYRGAGMDAWGRNASFQLACIHRLCQDLGEAAAILKQKPRPIWSRIETGLPKVCLMGPEGDEEIALWEGTPLEESHLHHSHLAAITPFDLLDLDDADTAGLVERSLRRWLAQGPGLWSGWCVPWASMIQTRVGSADAAVLWLEIWRRVFTNQGHGTLHNIDFPGLSLMGGRSMGDLDKSHEIMQMDAGMSCVAALHELLLHERRGVTYLFAGAPNDWLQVGFRKVCTGGAFLLSAKRTRGKVGQVRIHSLAGGVLSLANPWAGAAATLRLADGSERRVSGRVLRLSVSKGQTATLKIQP
jgi:alpha-L-fucosidase 2